MADRLKHIAAMTAKVRSAFSAAYGDAAGTGVIRAPGELELLGSHTDYNDGFVLSMALDQALYVAFRPSRERRLRVRSEALGELAEIPLNNGSPTPGKPSWANIVRGVAAGLSARGVELPGLDMALLGDLPIGSGLSSSSTVSVGLALAVLHTVGKELPRDELARICRAAEQDFAGLPCGIMSPFTGLMARADHALLLDCLTLEHQQIPVESDEYDFLIADTGVKAGPSSAEAFARRRVQCREAVTLLARYDKHIGSLRHVAPELINDHFAQMPRETAARARHVVNENLRVLHAAGHLRAGRMAHFGRLLVESQTSLRDNFEVSFQEADMLARQAAAFGGELLGARMAGGGFGGTVLIVVHHVASDRLRSTLETEYFRQFGRRLTVLRSGPSAGAAVLEECRRA